MSASDDTSRPGGPLFDSEGRPRRVPLRRKVSLKFKEFRGFITEYSDNLSGGGMFIRTTSPQPPGTIFDFEFTLGNEYTIIHGIGEVVWVRSRDEGFDQPAGMGVRFLSLDPDSRKLIDQIVLERGDRPSSFDRPPAAAGGATAEIPQAGSERDDEGWNLQSPAATTGRVEVPRRERQEVLDWGDGEDGGDGGEVGGGDGGGDGGGFRDSGAGTAGETPLGDEDDPASRPTVAFPVQPARGAGGAPGAAERSGSSGLSDAWGPSAARSPVDSGRSPYLQSKVLPSSGKKGSSLSRSMAVSTGAPPPWRRWVLVLLVVALVGLGLYFGSGWILDRMAGTDEPETVTASTEGTAEVAEGAAEGAAAGAGDGARGQGADGAREEGPGTEPPVREGLLDLQRDAQLGEEELGEPLSMDQVLGAEEGPGEAADAQPAAPPEPVEEAPRPVAQEPERRPSAEPAPRQASRFGRVLNITWERRGQGVALLVQADGRIEEWDYTFNRLESPPRELVRLQGVAGPFPRTEIPVGQGGVERVRIGYHPKPQGNELHLVVDLSGPGYRLLDTQAEGNLLTLRVAPRQGDGGP